MSYFKGALQATLALLLLAVLAMPVQARIVIDALGGELIVEGFLKSETRARLFAGSSHLGQWIQKFQVEAALEYSDIGIFDELAFVVIARPEYDIVQDMGDLSSNRVGDGTTQPGRSDLDTFNFANDGLGFAGFDFILGGRAVAGTGPHVSTHTTGGIGRLVQHGLANPSFLAQNFEVAFQRTAENNKPSNTNSTFFGTSSLGAGQSAFPLVVQKSSNLNLDCHRCVDLNVDNLDVATGNTDSNGRFYPFREMYVDGIIGDWWIRVGKQQIVWGKTDFFRLQDLINPVDFGQHFFFDSFEDIRIPQWMASIQYKAGSIGPLTDNAFQVVWNFDEFQPIGLGNPSHFWAHPFSKDTSTFAIFNTYFSVEPCVDANTAAGGNANGLNTNGTVFATSDTCGSLGPNDPRLPSGFGQPVGLSHSERPDWDIENTEAGFRWEFRVSDFRVALSHWYGWGDIPVFKFHSVNLPTRYITGLAPNDVLIGDLNALRQDINAINGVPAGGAPAASPLGFAQARIAAGVLTPYATGIGGSAVNNSGVFGGAVLAGVNDPIVVTTPQMAARLLANGANDPALAMAAQNALATGNYQPLWSGVDPVLAGAGGAAGGYAPFFNCGSQYGGTFCSPVAGGQTSIVHDRAHTVGLAVDYFESWSGVVLRIESSWTFDELVNNTRSADWVDNSDVMRFSLGFDRPTFIPFLNRTRTFFLSLQIFDTWYWDHEGDKNTGYFVDEHNWITTFFFLANYMRDTVKPVGFYVWEEATNSHVAGFNVEWLIDNHWSVKGGFHLIWEGDENTTHDTGPFTNFIATGPDFVQDPYVTSVLGLAREGLGALRNYDEVFFELKYQF